MDKFNVRPGMAVMDVVVGIILIVAAALPIAQNIVDNSTATGTTKTIINLIPLFVAIGAIVYVARGSGLAA